MPLLVLSGAGYDGVAEGAESFDRDVNDIPGRQKLGRVSFEPHSRWRAHRDDVARFELNKLRDVLNDRRDVENELARRCILLHNTVDGGNDSNIVRVESLVEEGDARSDRTRRGEVFSFRVLRDAELIVADGHIVEDRVTRDMIEGVLLLDQCCSETREQDWNVRDRQAGLGGVLAEVSRDTDDLARVRKRHE